MYDTLALKNLINFLRANVRPICFQNESTETNQQGAIISLDYFFHRISILSLQQVISNHRCY